MKKSTLLAASAFSVLALGVALPAQAKTAKADTAAAPATAPATAQGADTAQSANTDDGQSLGPDIVVTAQGRAQVLADVPIAVSVLNSASLERSGANDIRQLNQIAPSLLVSSTGNEANGSARLRGIGTVGDNPGLESSVAVFVDGVYRSRSGIGLNELGDIDRVEVLRGPQGTLFGRNASAGIISIYSKQPDFHFGAAGSATYGNYNYFRIDGNVNVPLSDTIAARIDGVYVKRDGFLNDVTNNTKLNDRNRYFLRGQLLFQPSADFSFRLIGDYTKRDEKCCGAVYLTSDEAPANALLTSPQNTIIRVLTSLGQPTAAFSNPFSRNVYVSPGRSYAGQTEDWGVSGEANWDFAGLHLTSITAYRGYFNTQGSDTDYSYVDLLYRTPGPDAGRRQFGTFSQELRLKGKAFGDHLDWLIGGYYGNETLTVRDNLRFGSQYGRFAACRIISGGGLAFAFDPTSSGCINPALRPTVSGAFGAAGPTILAAFDRLDGVVNTGDTRSTYIQKEENFAFFTHNIITITDGLNLTIGLRYTHENKRLNATFGNDNVACPAQQAAVGPFLSNAGLAAVAGGLIALTCQGNSTSELNGQSINSKRGEDALTGTAVLSYKVTPHTLLYGSYARGYKAGGFNLDRSALKNPLVSFASVGGAQAVAGNLQFAAERNAAYEIGLKFSSRPVSVNIAAFRQEFTNFQLNTFNGSVFLVQNINGCKTDLGGADRDGSATTGACAPGSTQPGVISQGVELETVLNPARNFQVTFGYTYADTYYRNNLVGNSAGSPLDPALRVLPGSQLSNAPKNVVTTSWSWTPRLGDGGLTGLFYMDGRLSSDYNTGSDLFPQKAQDAFFIANARVGVHGPKDKWGIEFWVQNLFDTNYQQVAFSSPFQAGAATGPFANGTVYPGGAQIFSSFLAEPRTFGVTVRGKF